MDENDQVPPAEQPGNPEVKPGENDPQQAHGQVLPGKSESGAPPEDPGEGEWVPV